jgi:hypothetical protein
VIYGEGQGQPAVPVFVDIPGILAALRESPGTTDVRATLDGLALATQDGRPLRLRPSFEVRSAPAGTKRFLVEDGSPAFDFGDGRRQRFTILP